MHPQHYSLTQLIKVKVAGVLTGMAHWTGARPRLSAHVNSMLLVLLLLCPMQQRTAPGLACNHRRATEASVVTHL